MRRPTISDLAKASGVSVATIDRVLNGRHRVREETARRVYEAAQSIGYHAVGLLRQRVFEDLPQYRLGFVLQKPSQPFYQSFAKEIGAAAAGGRHGSRPRASRFRCRIDTDGDCREAESHGGAKPGGRSGCTRLSGGDGRGGGIEGERHSRLFPCSPISRQACAKPMLASTTAKSDAQLPGRSPDPLTIKARSPASSEATDFTAMNCARSAFALFSRERA